METTDNTDAAPAPMPELSPQEKNALFAALDKAQTDRDSAKASAAKQFKDLDDKFYSACQAIYEKCGKGTYEYKGKLYNVVKAPKGGRATLRSANKPSVQKIG